MLRNSDLQARAQHGGDIIETPINYRKRTKLNVSEATFFSNDLSTASKVADKEN